MSDDHYAAIASQANALEMGKILRIGRVSNITVFKKYVAQVGVTSDLFHVYTVGGVCFIKRKSPRI